MTSDLLLGDAAGPVHSRPDRRRGLSTDHPAVPAHRLFPVQVRARYLRASLRPDAGRGAIQKGLTVQVWYPWFGVEASLLDSQIAEFNLTNEWGITVNATGQNNYTELHNNVAAALPGDDAPDVAIVLSGDAIAWDAAGSVVDLTDYVQDFEYGLGAADLADFPAVFWGQDEVDGRLLGVPAERGRVSSSTIRRGPGNLAGQSPPGILLGFSQAGVRRASSHGLR